MARKSNKTDHVLNLLSGHDTKTETPEETEAPAAEASPSTANEASPKEAPGGTASQTVSVIDTTEEDPLAELIQNKLSDEFEKHLPKADSNQEPSSEPEVTAVPEAAGKPDIVTTSDTDGGQEVTAVSEETAEPEAASADEPKATAADEAPSADEPKVTAADEISSADEPEAVSADEASSAENPETAPADEPETTSAKTASVPEPDFVPVNVMERIVKDKIDYFMDQFEVCKCDRCRADAIALTLTGLQPRYIVTAPAAVDPLLSYYTNKYTADVIVEATKACMIVKEKPRH